MPVLDGRASIKSLSRLWGLIYIGNLVGVALFAGFATVIGPALGIVEPQIFGEIARDRVTHSWWVILFSGVLAGWLMGLLSWLIAAGRDTISQIFFVWLIVLAIKFCHFHHSISGSVEVLAGILTSTLGITSLFYFLLWSTIGNAIGGIFFAMLVRNSLVMSSTKRSSNRRYDQHQQDSYKQRHRRR
ncbi:hypothetical protein B1A85_14770 [Chroococcidiopsis sp. TS-821]|nr:hypothetical protein B1A85_14770 [Chroococcidiopsis sp. TS-821]